MMSAASFKCNVSMYYIGGETNRPRFIKKRRQTESNSIRPLIDDGIADISGVKQSVAVSAASIGASYRLNISARRFHGNIF